MTRIRPAEARDAEAFVDVLAAADDTHIMNAQGWLYAVRAVPERARQLDLVAEEDGRVVGGGGAGLDWWATDTTEGWTAVAVVEDARGRGIGSALYERTLAHARTVGARRVRTLAREDGPGLAWAERRGWQPLRVDVVVGVDPRRVEPHPGVPGFDAVPLAALADRLDEVYALDTLVMHDEPSAVEHGEIPFDDWLAVQWKTPVKDHDGGTAVLEGDRIVALAYLEVDLARGRAANGFTATHPDYRGRGLATLAKTRSLRWAAERGICSVVTGNDETNAPMRAVNRRLGYGPVARRVELELALG